MPKLLEGDEREDKLNEIGGLAGLFWGITPQEGYQGCREINDQFREQFKIDGDPFDWIIGAGCRAKGATTQQREQLIALWGNLRQRRAG